MAEVTDGPNAQANKGMMGWGKSEATVLKKMVKGLRDAAKSGKSARSTLPDDQDRDLKTFEGEGFESGHVIRK